MLEGYNSTIIAYGQTGTGKTFTMDGFNYDLHTERRGIISRAVEQIFSSKHLQESLNPNLKYIITVSYFQIYKESISDLLEGKQK